MRIGTLLLCCVFPGEIFLTGTAQSTDHFLTISGGYSPSGNQISLEKNIVFYQRVLKNMGHGAAPHTLLFADGNDPGRDVQFEPAKSNVPAANRYMAKIFSSEKHIDLEYRDNQLEGVSGATTTTAIEDWFRTEGKKMKAGDRLVLYATAHGGKSVDKKRPYDTKLYLWNTKYIFAKRMAQLIDGLPDGVQVTLIMAQCYSGGYSHVLFEDADQAKQDQEQELCGFFSTVHNRMAAGCTADVDEENYDEFSSHFLAALQGASRTGKPIESADYDKDGRVTFEEAHAYTILTAKTIDIPIKTSDAYLRVRAKFPDKDQPEGLPKTAPYSQVLAAARSVDRVILERLSKKLALDGEDRHASATKKAAEIEKQRKELLDKDKQKKRQFDYAKGEMRKALAAKWPELANLMKPESIQVVTEQSKEFVAAVEAHPRFAEWEKLKTEREKIEEERFLLEKQWVQYRRFLHTTESVILAQNLEKAGDEKARKKYQQILRAESGRLASESWQEPSDHPFSPPSH